MAQKAYAKHSEYRSYSTKGSFNDKEFESMSTELLPAKYGSLVQPSNGVPAKNKEYYYEYKEEKDPSGKYDRKDLHTVEQYEYTHAPGEHLSYPSSGMISGPQKITTTTVTTTNRDLSHNIEELDSLLDDLQRDQDRKLYKSGYTSDTMESSSFDYRTTMPKTSTYTTTRIEKDGEWMSPTTTREVTREVSRNQFSESHLVPANPQPVPAVVCAKCQDHTNVQTTVSTTPMNKVTTTVKTYTYEVPADQDPTTIPIPGVTSPNATTTVAEKYVTNNRNYIQETHDNRTYANTHFETSTPVKQPPPPSPQLTTGCQFCTHCNSRITTTSTTSSPPVIYNPVPVGGESTKVVSRTTHFTTEHTLPGSPGYPANNSPTYSVPIDNTPKQNYPPINGGPPGPATYKYTTTNYTSYNTTDGRPKPGPFPASGHLSPPTSSSPFPRNESPAPRVQEPPKRLDELLADFPEADHRITDEGLRHRPNPARGPGGSINGNINSKETTKLQETIKLNENNAVTPSKNVQGSAVYYPPGHEMFARKDEAAAYQQAGGGYMKAKGKYQYEAESSSKSKQSSSVTAVPVCLPLCCAMPCTIL